MQKNIEVYAGVKALEIIHDEGLRPERVKIMAGAAGGPKWLVLGSLDRVIFGSFFSGRTSPLFLLGSSIGAWRFAALARTDGMRALDLLEEAYLRQSYGPRPSPGEVTAEGWRVLDRYLGGRAEMEILNHPFLRLNIMADRSRLLTSSDSKALLLPALGLAALCNAASRSSMGYFFERTLFFDSRDMPPFIDMDGFTLHRIPLNGENLRDAVMASGSIPLAMSGVRDIAGAPGGIYRDGGMLDYHLDISYGIAESLVLYPHFHHRIVPGWFDKTLPWRRASEANTANVVMVCPSREFIANLPYGKIPDRKDFKLFRGRDGERVRYWEKVVEMGRVLGEEFMEAVESGSIKEGVRALK
ncbi:MAG: alpha/beta hydrolase [Spirochaetae bacterium HGW-Spirochaetae-1]|jgi:hypothetical protein|nr:MAG: alpha/beta hydrolase [Spirochaetae bacterium HGW-Spirochaetae-1]